MFFYVYVLITKQKPFKTYVGWTNNLENRLLKHNSGKGARATRGRKWRILYTEKFDTKKEAMTKEYNLKKNKKFRKSLRERL